MIHRRAILLAAGLALAAPLLLAGCARTPMEWTRVATPAEQRDRDLKECTSTARRQAFEESQSSHPLYPPWTGTGFNWWPWAPVESPSYFARGPREAEFIDYCMKQRGYALTPVMPTTTPAR